MSEIKLSFIIPVYNVEKFIGECLESIYCQGVSEELFEVICIDDCSPDKSKEIVKQFQIKHNNIRLIKHDINKALGGARNTGLKSAKGTYVWFVDSDDMIKIDCIALLYNTLIQDEVNVLMFNYERVNQNGINIKKEIVFENTSVHIGRDYIDIFFGNSFVHHLGYVWRCVYSTEFLLNKKLFFPENCFWEDTVFFPKAILLAESVKSLNNVFYKYRVNEDSISGNNNKYKADRYYQYAFLAGYDLYNFAEQYKQIDKNLANLLSIKAIEYFNSFTKPLSLSSVSEKLKFYKLIDSDKVLKHSILNNLTFKNKLLLIPVFGLFLSLIFGLLFKLKKLIK